MNIRQQDMKERMPLEVPPVPHRAGSSRLWAWLLLITVGVLVIGIRMRLASMPLERDEGEYGYMAQLFLQGATPYTEAYGMKFPGIYLAYTAIIGMLGATDVAIRVALIFMVLASAAAIGCIVSRLVNFWSGCCAAASFGVLSLAGSMLGITANAEHFVLLSALLGILLLWEAQLWESCVVGGALLGFAGCVKQQGLIFVFCGAAWALFTIKRLPHKFLSTRRAAALLLLGIAIPFLLIGIWLVETKTVGPFAFWCFEYARHYGSTYGLSDGWKHFWHTFMPILKENATLFVAAGVGVWLCIHNHQRRALAFALVLGSAGFVAASPGLIFRPHYFLFLIPALSILAGVSLGRLRLLALPVLLIPLAMQWKLFFKDTPDQASQRLYPNNAFTEARQIGLWLGANLPVRTPIGILGSEPEILFYARRPSASPYIYIYPLMEPHPLAAGMQDDYIKGLERTHPPVVIHVRIPASWLANPERSEKRIFEWLPTFFSRYHRSRIIKIENSFQKPPSEYVIYTLQNPSQK